MDFYLAEEHVVDRMVREWEKYGSLIVAYDFDNTVFDFHDEGHRYEQVIELLKECKELGAYLMVYTAREDEELDFVKNYLHTNDIPYDSINETPPYIKFSGRKLYYNVLLDDRAGLASAYRTLKVACTIMKEKQTRI